MTYYCDSSLHDGVQTDADFYVKGWNSAADMLARTDDPRSTWSVCKDHLLHALEIIQLDCDDERTFIILRNVTGVAARTRSTVSQPATGGKQKEGSNDE